MRREWIRMKNTCNEIAKEIANDCESVSIDYLEMGIDSLLDDGVLKDIPVVKTVYTAIKLPKTISNAFNMKKLIRFCFHMKDIPSMERAKYVNTAIHEDKHFGEKLMLTLDKIDDLEKIEMLVKLFRAYGHRDGIDYHTFRRLCIVLEKTYIQDLYYLKECLDNKGDYFAGEQMINLSNSSLAVMSVVGGDLLNDNNFQILPLGQAFYECVFTDKYAFVV